MPERINEIMQGGTEAAYAIVAGIMIVGGAFAGLFKLGQKNFPAPWITRTQLKKLISETVKEEILPFRIEVNERAREVQRRLEAGDAAMREDQKWRREMELKQAYEKGVADGLKQKERRRDG